MIKLSLCIPTYNRVEDLKITLEEIINQLKNLDSKTRSEIHVHIQDNCSTDNSSYLIKKSPLKSEFINNGILFTYEVNKKNLGFDRNLLKCIDNSLGKYIWLISDDDHIFNNAIKKVFEYTVENFDMVNFQFNQLPNSILKPLENDYTEVNLSKNT